MKFKGTGASEGVAIGNIYFLSQPDLSVTKQNGCNPQKEKERIDHAVKQAKKELRQLYEKALTSDKKTAEVFEVHSMMLDDPDFIEGIQQQLEMTFNAEYAVRCTGDALKSMFESLEDGYMKARAADIADVTDRVVRILKGLNETQPQPDGDVIVLAEDLYPSQTMKLDKNSVKGFVTARGSTASHSVILARTMGIPCIVGVENFDALPHKGKIAINGKSGEITVNPDKKLAQQIHSLIKSQQEEKLQLQKYGGKAITRSGTEILVCANIGNPEDAQFALQNHADGVGLFRSEFIYLNSNGFPDEEIQFIAYKTVLEKLAPMPVVIRTLDLGSDKQASYFNIGKEDNPALGYRAIRICLKQQDIFVTQLRALLRASVYGKLNIMFPMISHLEQVKQIKEIVQRVKDSLTQQHIPFADDIQLGVMIETPAAVMISDLLAKEVDFFSIGTNDLTQYTLAVDRTNEKTVDLFDSSNIAVLRMISQTAQNAHANGIWVGICGESAADTSLTQFYADTGIDELSVSPSSVLKVKKAVCNCK